MTAVWVVLGVFVLVALLAVLLFNGLVRRRARTAEAWAQIDVELERRHDLVPRLVATVQGYAEHERTTFETVTAARADAVAAGRSGDPTRVASTENALSTALRSLFAVAENCPALQAVGAFRDLQEQLTATEDKLEFARRHYNVSARDYNAALLTFPRNLIAGALHFAPVGYFEAAGADRAAPDVSFDAGRPRPGPR
ncbi:MAG: LemA family protein [Jatrophihabitans sp.]|uniref:LemA family protein n=1 Tax=Jatrophihabitans sp. TaxID=1932789 RepID=UPI003F7CFACE